MKSAMYIVLFALLLVVIRAQVDPQITAVQGLIGRLLPNNVNNFQLELLTNNGTDSFELESTSATVVTLRGTSGSTMAQALNYYLKYFCNSSVSWHGNNLNIPTPLPSISGKISIQVPLPYRYYFNVCTFGYTTVWWSWERWEQEIDFMALNGINMPLAFTGQESVWRDVYMALGLADDDLNEFFTGPAFLPWNRMANIDQWGGNLTTHWLEGQVKLQQLILQRERSFGMKAVLPAFAGHVPVGLKKLFPSANITTLSSWNGFTPCYFLDPDDPLFQKIGAAFVARQTAVFGTDHLYNCDPFNELTPPTNESSYLAATSTAILKSLQAADPDGIWVMQAWFIVNKYNFWIGDGAAALQAYLKAIPIGKLIMLDLWADKIPAWSITEQFYGHYWIWCMLHNFGGRTGMFGTFSAYTEGPNAARAASPNMMGLGITPEAIETNVVVYDLFLEMSWRLGSAVDLTQWVQNYTVRRYGQYNAQLEDAWALLQNGVYNAPSNVQEVPWSYVAERPSIFLANNNLYYNTSAVVEAWTYFYQVAKSGQFPDSETFGHDCVSVGRQVLSNLFMELYNKLNSSFTANNLTGVNSAGALMLQIILDMDTLVATQPKFLVGAWINQSLYWATNTEEESLYNFNARNQLTLWGPTWSWLHDYAYKLWSGLLSDFYYNRWNFYIEYLASIISQSGTFDWTTFLPKMMNLEYAWNLETNTYPYEPTGDAATITIVLYEKYIKYL